MADNPGSSTGQTLGCDQAKASSVGPIGDQDWFKIACSHFDDVNLGS